jgi:hypothetical protein
MHMGAREGIAGDAVFREGIRIDAIYRESIGIEASGYNASVSKRVDATSRYRRELMHLILIAAR